MKALILAAGLGTRLKPYTDETPKCLFPIAGRPNLDRIIEQLIYAGCDSIAINTHSLHEMVEAFVDGRNYPISVQTRYEPDLLGTGGAIKNLDDFWDDEPFLIINSDVVTDVDLAAMAVFHSSHPFPVSLCLVNAPEFNIVGIDKDDFVLGFTRSADPEDPAAEYLTLSGIHVVDPIVLDFIEKGRFSSILDAYTKMMQQGYKIKAYRPLPVYWKDIGTPEAYQQAVYDKMAPEAFTAAFPGSFAGPIIKERIKGDGSDRIWSRVRGSGHSLIMADHGIRRSRETCEVDSFVSIGNHLYEKAVPVPKIHRYDLFSGLVFLEDLGDMDLQSACEKDPRPQSVKALYESVIRLIPDMCIRGGENFNPAWTCQTEAYDVPMILEKECRYFVDAFLNDYLGMGIDFKTLETEFTLVARKAAESEMPGFMHRDFQSRNIMLKNGRFYIIDFQGGRIGPPQYDLASLLVDPYVALSGDLVSQLKQYACNLFSGVMGITPEAFYSGYNACAVTRNLQILGAYAFLSRKRNKPYFEMYIPTALRTLKENLVLLDEPGVAALTNLAESIRLRQ